MDEERPRRRLTRLSRAARTKRILERLREGWAYEEVAGEMGLKERRVRQIVTEFLKEREAVSGAAHAHMQIDRLGRAMRVAGDALARGDIRAIAPFIRVIDRLDRYQTLAAQTAARPEAVVDGAADQLIVELIFARVRRTVLEEMRTQAAKATRRPPARPRSRTAIRPPSRRPSSPRRKTRRRHRRHPLRPPGGRCCRTASWLAPTFSPTFVHSVTGANCRAETKS